uniref:Uncharacterized protein n=1 Tax=Anguilla anguilla TaxID=7936 RepID=A0A0E9XL35_ANGAN
MNMETAPQEAHNTSSDTAPAESLSWVSLIRSCGPRSWSFITEIEA